VTSGHGDGRELCEARSTQRAMRRLESDPVPDSIIRQVVDLAICAPGAGKRPGWSLVVIRDRARPGRLVTAALVPLGEPGRPRVAP